MVAAVVTGDRRRRATVAANVAGDFLVLGQQQQRWLRHDENGKRVWGVRYEMRAK